MADKLNENKMNKNSIEIDNYTILKVVDRSSSTITCLAHKIDNQKPVILKFNQTPSFESEFYLKREYEVLSRVHSPMIIKSLGLETIKNRLVLILEEYYDLNLQDLMTNFNLEILDFLKISDQLASSLVELHEAHIFHKNLLPQNILIDMDLKTIKLIGFEKASLLAHEIQDPIIDPKLLENAIFYISPEQTGRMNRMIDFRTDIYSFGVILYRLFTKTLPFVAENPNEVIYKHILMHPDSPHKVDITIPEPISAIIMKCLAKNPEDRYQNASSLKKDIEFCLELVMSRGFIDSFSPVSQEAPNQLLISQKLYGREHEINYFRNILRDLSEGSIQAVFLRGEQGLGLTTLGKELDKLALENNSHFISGTYEKTKSNHPYSGLLQAFRSLIKKVLGESDEKLIFWKEQILNAVGENGKIITDIIPDVKLIIGEQHPVPEMEPLQAENRFKYTLTNFIQVFLREKHSIILFLDDLKWIDEGSIRFLEFFTKNITAGYFLLVGTYHDEEFQQNAPVYLLIEKLKNNEIPVYYLDIMPLSYEATSSLIKDTFNLDLANSVALTTKIYNIAKGSPLFTIECLQALCKDKIINYSDISQGWMIDFEKSEQMMIPDNLFDFITQKLLKLNKNSRRLLEIGSAIGKNFNLSGLAELYHNSLEKTLSDLDEALDEELIVHKATLRGTNENEGICFVFKHEVIAQAAYELITQDELSRLHFDIGLMLQKQAGKKKQEYIFDIISQLLRGSTCLAAQESQFELAKLTFEASRSARQVGAYYIEGRYLRNMLELLGPACWDISHELSFDLHINLIECKQITEGFEKSERKLNETFKRARNNDEKGILYLLKINLLNYYGKFDEAFQTAKEAFALYGVNFNLAPTEYQWKILFLRILGKYWIKGFDNLSEMPSATDKSALILGKLYSKLLYTAHHGGTDNITIMIALQLNELTLKYGVLEESSMALVTFGTLLCTEYVRMTYQGLKVGKASQNIGLRFPGSVSSAEAGHIFALFIQRWEAIPRDQFEYLNLNYKQLLGVGNFVYIGSNRLELLQIKGLIYGEDLSSTLNETELWINRLMNYDVVVDLCSTFLFHKLLLNLSDRESDAYENWKEKNSKIVEYALTHHNVGMFENAYNYIYLFLTEAPIFHLQAAIAKMDEFKERHTGLMIWDIFYFYYGLGLCQLYEANPSNQTWKKIIKIIQMFKRWSKLNPKRFGHHYLLLTGRKKFLKKQFQSAIQDYETCIDIAQTNGYKLDLALAFKLLAICNLSIKNEQLATHYMQESFDNYLVIGALKVAKILRENYSSLLKSFEGFRETVDLESMTRTMTITTTTETWLREKSKGTDLSMAEFDIEAIIEASQAISREILFDKLIKSLMHVVLVNAGATKAALIKDEEDVLTIQAEASIEGAGPMNYNVYLEAKPLENLSIPLVKYVARIKKLVLLNNPLTEGPFRQDPYIHERHIKSILCLPMMRKNELKGILYLENNMSNEAFTPNRLKTLNVLSTQIAIALENAQFYSTLEKKIENRTKELTDKNVMLEQTYRQLHKVQEQLIQKEKLASLGTLTAGIANELKEPLHSIIYYSQHAAQHLTEIIDLLKENNNLNFSELQDMHQQIDLMNSEVIHQSERVDRIINSMVSHAHPGKSEEELINVHDLIERSLSVVKDIFRKKTSYLTIEVIKKYDPELPNIKAFPLELTRVLFNLLDNAFQALLDKQKSVGSFFSSIQITTMQNENEVKIIIEDNGLGIPLENQDKIFKSFFTTKTAGVGVGLGLAISYDIITKQHAGTLVFESEELKFTRFIISLPKK